MDGIRDEVAMAKLDFNEVFGKVSYAMANICGLIEAAQDNYRYTLTSPIPLLLFRLVTEVDASCSNVCRLEVNKRIKLFDALQNLKVSTPKQDISAVYPHQTDRCSV